MEAKEMRTSTTLGVLILSLAFLSLKPNGVMGISLKPVEEINFEQDPNFKKIPLSFCVSEDGLFLIPHQESGYIKIFKQDGKSLKFLNILGRSGLDSDEFNKPVYCFYDKYDNEKKFGVMDPGLRKVFIFNFNDKGNFKLVNIVPNKNAYDMKLAGNGEQLIIAGYTVYRRKSYELYSINLENPSKKDFLLPTYQKYHLANDLEYTFEYNKGTLPAIGIRAFIDVYEDDVYLVWEGKLKIIKIDIKTKETSTFGHKTGNYREPSPTHELIKSYRQQDSSKTLSERIKMSFIRDIFVTFQHVFVIYEGPDKSNFRIQMYTREGKFLDEKAIPGNHNTYYREMWFDKDGYTLYSLLVAENKPSKILVYKVNT
jgi:hypothetical protein